MPIQPDHCCSGPHMSRGQDFHRGLESTSGGLGGGGSLHPHVAAAALGGLNPQPLHNCTLQDQFICPKPSKWIPHKKKASRAVACAVSHSAYTRVPAPKILKRVFKAPLMRHAISWWNPKWKSVRGSSALHRATHHCPLGGSVSIHNYSPPPLRVWCPGSSGCRSGVAEPICLILLGATIHPSPPLGPPYSTGCIRSHGVNTEMRHSTCVVRRFACGCLRYKDGCQAAHQHHVSV